MDEKTKLRPYQEEDVQFLLSLKRAGCLNQQRTGKTPTSLTVFKRKGIEKFLIVCPNSAIYGWQDEVKRWYNTDITIAQGTKAKRIKLYQSWKKGALIINYELLRGTKAAQDDLTQILKHDIEGLIIDEAHRLKNPKSRQAKALQRFQKIPHVLLLTGTPAPNKPHEIFYLFNMIDPQRYNSCWKFWDHYFQMYEESTYVGGQARSFKVVGKAKPDKKQELLRFINENCTMRKRKDVMSWLPDKDRRTIKLPLSKEQGKYLHELEEFYETGDGTVMTMGTLDRLIRYRQICQAPALLGLKGRAPKVDWLQSYLKDYEEESIIIFSKLTSFLKVISKELDLPHLIIGETPKPRRAQLVKDFQAGNIRVLLLNIDACKEALTLDQADTAIFLDKYPPAGDIDQAEDRFVATTQEKKDKPHKIIDVMMSDSYDEALFHLVAKRKSETEIINNYKNYLRR